MENLDVIVSVTGTTLWAVGILDFQDVFYTDEKLGCGWQVNRFHFLTFTESCLTQTKFWSAHSILSVGLVNHIL